MGKESIRLEFGIVVGDLGVLLNMVGEDGWG